MKKRLSILLTLCLILTGCVSHTTNEKTTSKKDKKTSKENISEIVSSMDLKTKVEQMLMVDIRSWDGVAFTKMNEEVNQMLSEFHFGGVILFSENFDNNEQVVNLTQSMQEATIQGGGQPLFIGTDQEGGYVTRLTNGTTTVGNMALAATGDPENAKESAEIISSELEALGLNLDFAPSLDVNSNPANPIIGVRSFSDDPETVSEFGFAYLKGLKENNVIGTVKHFPGHGDTDTDSHTGLPLVDRSEEEIENEDLLPFKTLIKENAVDMVMTAHIQFPQIETETYTSILDGSTINLPATLSKTWITDILRNEMGFKGVVITDSLQMQAIASHFSMKDSAKLAINAGANILLMPIALNGSDSIEQIDSYIDDIVDMVKDGEIEESKIDDSCIKILTLKQKRKILSQSYDEESTQSLLSNVDSKVGSTQSHVKEREIGDKAITVLKNENGLLPYTCEESTRITMIAQSTSQKNILQYGFNILKEENIIPQNANVMIKSEEYGDNYEDCLKSIEGADLLVVTSTSYVQEYINAAKQRGIPVVTISTDVPYDTAYFQEADAILCAYNGLGANQVDDSFTPTSTYSVNLMCCEDILFGKSSANGKLPVDVPYIINGSYTSDILYPRGTGITW